MISKSLTLITHKWWLRFATDWQIDNGCEGTVTYLCQHHWDCSTNKKYPGVSASRYTPAEEKKWLAKISHATEWTETVASGFQYKSVNASVNNNNKERKAFKRVQIFVRCVRGVCGVGGGGWWAGCHVCTREVGQISTPAIKNVSIVLPKITKWSRCWSAPTGLFQTGCRHSRR